MICISFDVGIKNLAYCIIEVKDELFQIIGWDVITLCKDKERGDKINLIDAGRVLRDKFDIAFEGLIFDNVLIENQMGNLAIRMKTLQGMITQYFIMKNSKNIVFISSINKLKPYLGSLKTTYAERKKYSILICKKYLEKTVDLSGWLPLFEKHKKKDDLADAFLQAMSYMYKKNILKNKLIINAVDLKV